MKIYHKYYKDLLELDKKIDVLNSKISKNEKKQKIILLHIDDEFTLHFNQNLNFQCKEVTSFFASFFGLKLASCDLLSV